MSDNLWIILWGALLTYATRAGGHLVLSRFRNIPPRVEAGLNAVPAAVLTTLVAPAVVGAGIAEIVALVVAGFASLRGGVMGGFFAGGAILVLLRNTLG